MNGSNISTMQIGADWGYLKLQKGHRPWKIKMPEYPEGTSVNSAICEDISKFCLRFYNGGVWEISFSITNKLPKHSSQK